MPKRKMPSIAECEDAIREARGMVAVAARKLGVSRPWMYKKLKESKRLRESREDAREMMKDTAELRLFAMINSPEHPAHFKAVRLYLERQAQDRGYGQASNSAPPPTRNKAEESRLDDAALDAGLSALGLDPLGAPGDG